MTYTEKDYENHIENELKDQVIFLFQINYMKKDLFNP